MNKREVIGNIRRGVEDSKGTHIWGDYVNALKLISQVVFTRSSGFILELLQNAEDAGAGLSEPGQFEIRINGSRAKITHNGRPFSDDDVKAICGIRSSKKPERGTLGYLGIGFKSVFKASDCPEIYSNGFQFKFDRNAWSDPSQTPWHVIPIWVDEPSETVDSEKTTFIIPFRDRGYNSILLEEMRKFKTELYLFLRWLTVIRIVDEVTGQASMLENGGEDKDGITTLKGDGQAKKFRIFRCPVEVPDWVKQDRLTQEYRANVTHREITLAFALDEKGNLAPWEAIAMYGGVYSFLPLGEARSGVKFPIQADFLVQPGRDAINYEAPWNHWLVQETTNMCENAIEHFKAHPVWKYQYLQEFEFTETRGLESYDKLFGPDLINPIKNFLLETKSIPTDDDGWASPDEVVQLKEEQAAVEDLVKMGIFKKDEIAPAFGGQPGLKLAHTKARCSTKLVREVDRWDLLKNNAFLQEKCHEEGAASWARAFYLWLSKHPAHEIIRVGKSQRSRIKMYHDADFILTADQQLLKGGKVAVLDLQTFDFLKDLARNWTRAQDVALLHPDILAGGKDEEERKSLRGFLTGYTGVQVLNSKDVCRNQLLPLIQTRSPKPLADDLVRYTIYCQQILGREIGRDAAIWVLTKQGEIRAANEVFFAKELRPEQNWEMYPEYLPGVSFVSPKYTENGTSDEELKGWREFFRAGGVGDVPDGAVEEFAINYARERLELMYENVTPVERRKFGWDIEARTRTGERVFVEVKGQSTDQPVELRGNEAEAADKYGHCFHLYVVASIPYSPGLYVLKNPARFAERDKLTVPVEVWKASGAQ